MVIVFAVGDKLHKKRRHPMIPERGRGDKRPLKTAGARAV